MAEDNRIVPYYKDQEHPRYAHTKKERDALEADNWTADPHAIPVQQYPKALYSQEGVMAKARDAAHEAQLVEQGYSTTPVAPQAPQVKAQAASDGASVGRLDTLEQRMDGLEDKLNEILAAVTNPSEKRRK